jgi:hypothetical protein
MGHAWRLLALRAGIVFVLSIAALPWPVASLSSLVILPATIAVVILYVIAVLLAYVLVWSGLELATGFHLRSRARIALRLGASSLGS